MGNAPGQPGAGVVWFTGLSGSGKSAIAERVFAALEVPAEYLDGDAVREAFPSTGFTKEERDLHIRRIGFLAAKLEKHGVCVGDRVTTDLSCDLRVPDRDAAGAVRRIKEFLREGEVIYKPW